MSRGEPSAPWQWLDDDAAGPPVEVLLIGCGNLLRGDDAAGPVLIRRLWQRPEFAPDGAAARRVRLADGGTSGMDVVFQMRGAERVVIVDAALTGRAPGTIYRVPGAELAQVPDITTMGSHDFRWDNAIAVGRWLLGPYLPSQIDVVLIEGSDFGFGQPLSPAVSGAVDRVGRALMLEFLSGEVR